MAEKETKVAKVEVKPIPSDREGLLGSVVTQSADLAIKLARSVDDRVDRLLGESVDTVENLLLGVIRAVRDTGRNVTDIATNLTRPREIPRAA